MRLAVEKSVAACSVLVAHTRSILGIRFAVLSECSKEDLSIRLAVCNELRFHASLVWSPLATQATLRFEDGCFRLPWMVGLSGSCSNCVKSSSQPSIRMWLAVRSERMYLDGFNS